MPVQGDPQWNALMGQLASEEDTTLQARAAEELASREAAGTGAVVAGRVKDAVNAAGAGVLESLFQTKDFVFGEPAQQDKWAFRQDAERAGRELRALSRWNGAVESVAQFATGFTGLGYIKALRGGALVNSGRAAITGAVAFDPHEERLSNFVESFPALKNPITGYLAAKDDDTGAAGRLKNAAESLMMDGVAATAVVAISKLVKAVRSGDKVKIAEAQRDVEASNSALADSQDEWHRKMFVDEQTTQQAQADLLNREIMSQEPQGGVGKDFGGQGAAPAEAAPQAPQPMGGRAEALDREMRQLPDTPEVPGAGAIEAPTAAPTEQPFGGGGMADALDREMRQQAGEQVDDVIPSGDIGPGAEPPPGSGTPVAQGEGGTQSAGRADAGFSDAELGPRGDVSPGAAPDAPRPGLEQVPSGEAPRKQAGPAVTRVPEPTTEDVSKMVAASRRDATALSAANNSVEEAIENGHVFKPSDVIPWQKLQAGTEEVGQFMRRMVDLFDTDIGKARGGNAEGVLSDTRVNQLVRQRVALFNEDPAALMGMLRDAGDTARTMAANMEVGYTIANRMLLDNYEFLRRLDAGNLMGHGSREQALEVLKLRTQVAMDAVGAAQSMLSNSARSMRRARSEFQLRANDLARINIGNLDAEAVANLLRSTEGNTAKMAQAMQPSMLNRAVDFAGMLHSANLLWGWSTHVVNTAMNVSQLYLRPINAALGAKAVKEFSILTGNEAKAQAMDAIIRRARVEAVSTASTIRDGLGAFKVAFQRGDSRLAPHSSEYFTDATGLNRVGIGEMPQWSEMNSIGDVINNGLKAGIFLATGNLRAMGAADEMIKEIRYRGIIMGKASIEAEEMGLKQGSKAYKDYVTQRVAASFDDQGRALDVDALNETRATVFQNDLGLGKDDIWLGKQSFGSVVQNAAANIPLARFVVPFVKTPTNLFRYGIKLTPGLNLLQKEYLNAIRGVHGIEQQAQAMGQMMMGITLLSAGVMLRRNGMMTGSGPGDIKQAQEWKAAGNMPYAFRPAGAPEGAQFQLNRFDPVQFPLALAADFTDLIMQGALTEDQEHSIAGALVLAVAHQLKDKTYLKGVSDAIDAMMDPEKGKMWPARFVPGMLPWSSLMRSVNPDPYLREVTGMVDAIKATIPGYSETLPARYDALGKPIKVPGRFVNTLERDTELNRALEDIFLRTGNYPLSAPSPYLGEGVGHLDMRVMALESGQNAYERYKQLSGQPKGRPSLEDALTKLVQTDRFKSMMGTELAAGVDGAQAMVTQLVSDYRKAAMNQMMAEDKTFREARGKRSLEVFRASSVGKKDLKSAEAQGVAKQVNQLLAPYGMGVPVPAKQPME